MADEPPANADLRDPREEVRRLIEHYRDARLDAVVSTDDYPGSALASVLAQALGLPGVSPAVNLRCQHKYYSRIDQQKFAPDAVPYFRCVDQTQLPSLEELAFPVFVKPVKSFFSVGAYRVDSPAELFRIGWKTASQTSFFRPFEILLADHANLDLGPPVLVEGLLQGMQVTVEGYVHAGDVRIIAIVDSVMYPDTLSFQRFEYPSALPDAVQERMSVIARRVIAGIGFDNGLFNMEMIHDPRRDSIHIIEINPRMASQFADLYEKVDGTNTYEVLLDLALGKKPVFRQGRGAHGFAASCVLRTFENAMVAELPSDAEIAQVRDWYPDIRVEILATQGRRLSQEMQDGRSYRYGILSIGGRDREETLAIYERCKAQLTFKLDKVDQVSTWPEGKVA